VKDVPVSMSMWKKIAPYQYNNNYYIDRELYIIFGSDSTIEIKRYFASPLVSDVAYYLSVLITI